VSHENSSNCISAICYKAATDTGAIQKHIDSYRSSFFLLDEKNENKITKYFDLMKNKLNHIPHKLKDESGL